MRTSQQVEYSIRSHQPTLTSSIILLNRLCQSTIIKKRAFRKTRGILANKFLLGNGVIITVHHGMIHQNAKLERHFLEKLLTSGLSNRTLVESEPDASTLLALSSTTLTTSTIVDEEEQEHLFHTQIWAQKNPLHLIMDNGSQRTSFLKIL